MMPASTADPISASIQNSLSNRKGQGTSSLLKPPASSHQIYSNPIAYDPADRPMSGRCSELKNKCIVISTQTNGIGNDGTKVVGSSKNLSGEKVLLPLPKKILFPLEEVQLGWKNITPTGSGFINMGNTCYLNSTLQALFHVPSFINWLLNDKKHAARCDQNNGSFQQCMICLMAKTLRHSLLKTGEAFRPSQIYGKLKMICKHMVQGRQEDAHEFMRHLLEAMEKSYLVSMQGTKLDSYSKETTPVNQIFGGYIRSEVECLRCGAVSPTFQAFQELPLDIRQVGSMYEALTSYFHKERLDGDNAYKCENCRSKVPATKKFSLERPPIVLCIQLKRFNMSGGKILRHIQCPKTLDLTRFLHASAPSPIYPPSYKLVAIITHIGSTPTSGHYTAVADTASGSWYQFDDSYVRPISANSAQSTDAYVIFYEITGRSSDTMQRNNYLHSVVAKKPSVQPTVNGTSNGVTSHASKDVGVPVLGKTITIANDSNKSLPSSPKCAVSPKPLLSAKERSIAPSALRPNSLSVPSNNTIQIPKGIIITPVTSSTIQNSTQIILKKTDEKMVNGSLVPYSGESSDSTDDENENPKSKNKDCKIAKDGVGHILQELRVNTSNNVMSTSNNNTNTITIPVRSTSKSWLVSNTNQHSPSSESNSSANSSTGEWVVTENGDINTQHKKPDELVENGDVVHSPKKKRKEDFNYSENEKKQEVIKETTQETNGQDSKRPERVPSTDASPIISSKSSSTSKSLTSSPVASTSKSTLSNSWDGSRNTDVVNHLKQMNHRGYGDKVQSWSGEKSLVDKSAHEDRKKENALTEEEIYNQELDKGKERKLKSSDDSRRNSTFGHSSNPFQEAHDHRNNSSTSDYPNSYNSGNRSNGYSQNNRQRSYSEDHQNSWKHNGYRSYGKHRNHPYQNYERGDDYRFPRNNYHRSPCQNDTYNVNYSRR